MHIHGLSAEQSLVSLNTTAAGLLAPEAARRLAEFGPNHVEEVAREHLLLGFAREFTHFFAIILWIGAALAFLAEHFDPGQGMARLGIAIVGVIIVNGVFSFWQEYKAEKAVAALRQLLPQKVQALRDGAIVEMLASELVPGDIVVLEEGDFVPADCRLIEAFALRVNTATVTGESKPMARNTEPSTEDSPLYARNVLLAGTSIVSGQARAVVYATGMRTEFGRIAHLTQTAGAVSSPLQREIARLSRIVAALATGMGLVLFFVGQAMGLPPWENALFAIGIIVANVPEGLLPTVTLSLAMATQRMARRNALVRHLPAVEALGSTTTICCDKTGTLTQNRMSVQRLWLGGGFLDFGDMAAQPSLTRDNRELFVNAALCHNLKVVDVHGQNTLLGDPMEVALAAMGRQATGDLGGPPADRRDSFRHRPQAHVGPQRNLAGPHALLQGRAGDRHRGLRLRAVRRGPHSARPGRSHPPAGGAAADGRSRTARAGLRPCRSSRWHARRRARHDPLRPGRAGRPAASGSAGRHRPLRHGRHPHHHGHRRPSADGAGHRAPDRPGQVRATGGDHRRRTAPSRRPTCNWHSMPRRSSSPASPPSRRC
jgi:magnesium-transporting ATPase (P-type)